MRRFWQRNALPLISSHFGDRSWTWRHGFHHPFRYRSCALPNQHCGAYPNQRPPTPPTISSPHPTAQQRQQNNMLSTDGPLPTAFRRNKQRRSTPRWRRSSRCRRMSSASALRLRGGSPPSIAPLTPHKLLSRRHSRPLLLRTPQGSASQLGAGRALTAGVPTPTA